MSPTSPSDTSLVERLRTFVRMMREESDRAKGAAGLQFKALAKILGDGILQAADRIEALQTRNRELEAGLPIVAYMKPDGEVLVPDGSPLKELLAGLQPVPAPLGGAPLLPLRALTASRPKP